MGEPAYQLFQKEVRRASTKEQWTQYSVRFSEALWNGKKALSGPTFGSFPPGSDGLPKEDLSQELANRSYQCIVSLLGVSFVPKHVQIIFVEKDQSARGQLHLSIRRAELDLTPVEKLTFVFFELDASLRTVHAMGGISSTDFWLFKRNKPKFYELPRSRLRHDLWFDAVSLQQESRSSLSSVLVDSAASGGGAITGAVRTFFDNNPSSMEMVKANISMAHMLQARANMLDAAARFQHTNQLSRAKAGAGAVGLGSISTHATVKTESEVRTLVRFSDLDGAALQVAAHQATFHAFRANVYAAPLLRAGKIEAIERNWFRRQEVVLLSLLLTNSPHLYSQDELVKVLCGHFGVTEDKSGASWQGEIGGLLELELPFDSPEILGVEGTVIRFSNKFLLDCFLPLYLEQKIRAEEQEQEQEAYDPDLEDAAEAIREERKFRRVQSSKFMPTKNFDENTLPDIEDMAGNKLLSPICVLRLRKKLEETTDRFRYPERMQYTGALLDTNRSPATVERHLRKHYLRRGVSSADFDKKYATSCKRRETGLWNGEHRTIAYGQSCDTLTQVARDQTMVSGCPFAQNVPAELDSLLEYAEVPQEQRRRIKEIASDGQGRAARRACASMFASVFKTDRAAPPSAPRVYFGRAWEIVRKTLDSMPDA